MFQITAKVEGMGSDPVKLVLFGSTFLVVPPCYMMSVRLYKKKLFNRFTARVLRESLSVCLYSCCCCCIVVLRPR